MDQKELFSQIVKKLTSKYSIKSKIIPTFRYIENGKSLYLLIKYKRKTEYNVFQSIDLYFSIALDEKFPDSSPYVRALSSFSFPSLNDNSNLYQNITIFKDSNITSKKNDPFVIIEDIVLGIPMFIENIKLNEEKKKFYYYGEYSLDEIYDINDFFSGKSVEFYRVNQIIKQNTFKKYIILNDVYFLLFDPVPDSNNYAKLIFISDILLLKNNSIEDNNEKTVNFEWKNDKNEVIRMCFKFEQKYVEFINGKNAKINKLINTYNIKINNKSDSNNELNIINNNLNINYNTKGFQISKSFQYDIIES
jgi:hypothetical protein